MWSSTKSRQRVGWTFRMRAMRMRPGAPSWSSTAITTIALPSAPRPRLPGLLTTADVGLVDLDRPGEQLTAGQHHRAAQLVQPRPRRLVAAEAEHPLQPERADAVLLVDHVPDRREPAPQRQPATVEDRPGGDRGLVSADRAAAQPAANRPPVAADRPAEATHEPLAPADALEVAQTRPLVGEPRPSAHGRYAGSRSPAAARWTARRHATTPGGRKWIAHIADPGAESKMALGLRRPPGAVRG